MSIILQHQIYLLLLLLTLVVIVIAAIVNLLIARYIYMYLDNTIIIAWQYTIVTGFVPFFRNKFQGHFQD